MIFRVNGLTTSETSELLGPTLDRLQVFGEKFLRKSFGGNIGQITVVLVSSFDDESNERHVSTLQGKSSYRDYFTKEKIISLNFAVALAQEEICELTDDEILRLACDRLLENVEKKEIRIPKGFDYGEFSKSIKTEISHVLAEY